MGGRLRGGQGRPLEYLTAVGRLKESPEPRLLASAATAAVSSAPGFWFVALSRLCAQTASHGAHHRELDADVGCCWRGGVRCQHRERWLVVRLRRGRGPENPGYGSGVGCAACPAHLWRWRTIE